PRAPLRRPGARSGHRAVARPGRARGRRTPLGAAADEGADGAGAGAPPRAPVVRAVLPRPAAPVARARAGGGRGRRGRRRRGPAGPRGAAAGPSAPERVGSALVLRLPPPPSSPPPSGPARTPLPPGPAAGGG